MTGTLLKADKVTLALEALRDGKIRVRAQSWDDAHTVLAAQILAVRNLDRQVVIERRHGTAAALTT